MQEEFNFWFWKRRELFLVTICYLYFTLKQLIIREEGSPNMFMLRVGWLFSKSAKSAKCFHDTVQCFILISSERQYCLLRGCMHQRFRKCSSPTENWTPPRKQFRTGVTCHKVSRPSRQIADQDIHANITGYHRYQNVSDGNRSREFWVSSHVLLLCYRSL